MKQIEIEAIFTAKVTEYIQKGYTINTTTMSGHQGEIAKIDLRKGDEIIRVMLKRECEFAGHRREYVALKVGRYTKQFWQHAPFDTMCSTIWENDLEIIEERRFYWIDNRADYFTESEAEYAEAMHRQYERYCVNDCRDRKVEIKGATQIAKRMIKRKTGKSRLSGDIRVYRLEIKGERTQYIAEYNGRGYKFA